MNKRTGILLIVLTSVAIIGIAIFQIYWIGNAYELKKTQLNAQIKMSLKAVANNLFRIQNSKTRQQLFSSQDNTEDSISNNINNINYVLIDSLLLNEFKSLQANLNFKYGIYLSGTKKLLGGDFQNFEQQILDSEFKTPLSCLRIGSPYFLAIYIPDTNNLILQNLIWGFVFSGLFVLIVGFSFAFTIVIIYRQKRISLIKNDFVNNMTHEFKTPIATVSLVSEMLLKTEVQNDKEKIKKYAKIIYEENIRLKNQVEEVLQVALLDKGQLKIRKREIDVHKLLDQIISNSEIFILERDGIIKKVYSAARSKIRADKMHLTNIIGNLLDNANKYSPEKPIITVRTKNIKKGILISVEDKGIGIKTEDQANIFNQFHRAHTGNIHDVKGFGLGLFYAEKMVKEHGGFIRLNSTFGSGSTFEIYLPFNEIRKD